jgi:hypothetical protein
MSLLKEEWLSLMLISFFSAVNLYAVYKGSRSY